MLVLAMHPSMYAMRAGHGGCRICKDHGTFQALVHPSDPAALSPGCYINADAAISAALVAASLGLVLLLPESGRWLLVKGRKEEALQASRPHAACDICFARTDPAYAASSARLGRRNHGARIG